MITRYNNNLEQDSAGWWVHITDHMLIVENLHAENRTLRNAAVIASEGVERLRAENEVLRTLLGEARDDVDTELARMEQMYGENYKRERIAGQRDLLARIDAALAAAKEGW
jgi:hypothetical protein